MAVVRTPLQNMDGDSEIKAYVGVLERRVLFLMMQEIRFRAMLEALTGQPWDDQYGDLDQDGIDTHIVESLQVSLGITKDEALRQLQAHKDRANARNIVEYNDPNYQTHKPAGL